MYTLAFSLLIPFSLMAFYHGANLLKSNHCRSLVLNRSASKVLDSTVDAKLSYLNSLSWKCEFILSETEKGSEALFYKRGKKLKVNWKLESGPDYDS